MNRHCAKLHAISRNMAFQMGLKLQEIAFRPLLTYVEFTYV